MQNALVLGEINMKGEGGKEKEKRIFFYIINGIKHPKTHLSELQSQKTSEVSGGGGRNTRYASLSDPDPLNLTRDPQPCIEGRPSIHSIRARGGVKAGPLRKKNF